FSLQLQGSYVLSPSTLFSLQSGLNRQDAQAEPYSYSAYWFGAGYSQDLPFGFSAGLQPSYVITAYGAPLAGFGVTPRGHTANVNVSLLTRRFDYPGFTPRFSVSYTSQHSNIALYSYSAACSRSA